MFTFTKRADYALLALSYLANMNEGKLAGPREIAAKHDIPGELLAKILQSLAKRRLVTSVPGPTGGYRLSRSPVEISLAEVVEAVDGPLAIAQCWDTKGVDGCAQSRQCHLRGPLARIQEEMTKLLQTMTLSEVLGPPRRAYAGKYSLSMAQEHEKTAVSDTARLPLRPGTN